MDSVIRIIRAERRDRLTARLAAFAIIFAASAFGAALLSAAGAR